MDPYYGKQRRDLPFHRAANGQSIVGLLKNMIGKDLSSFSFPITFSEPISMTQRVAEIGKPFEILKTASTFEDPYERCAWVHSYFLTFFGDFYQRVNKPANPLLHETYEICGNDWRAFSEQVSHHPPVTACYIESDYAQVHANTALKLSFWGKSIDVSIKSLIRVRLMNPKLGFDETYEINIPKNAANNLLFGKITNFNHWGDITCKCVESGIESKGKMTALNGMFIKDKDKSKINAVVMDSATKEEKFKIHGHYMKDCSISKYDKPSKSYVDPTLVHQQYIVRDTAENDSWDEIYRFSDMALSMNSTDEQLEKKLPPTDSRFRQDNRCMEEGRMEESQAHKNRLEDE